MLNTFETGCSVHIVRIYGCIPKNSKLEVKLDGFALYIPSISISKLDIFPCYIEYFVQN